MNWHSFDVAAFQIGRGRAEVSGNPVEDGRKARPRLRRVLEVLLRRRPRPSRHSDWTAYNDLRNLAHRDGRDPAEYFTLYALEAFLTRLAVSEYAGGFVLKGGLLMAAFVARRPTRDIDLAASGFANDIPDVEHRVRAVIARDLSDGLVFVATRTPGGGTSSTSPRSSVHETSATATNVAHSRLSLRTGRSYSNRWAACESDAEPCPGHVVHLVPHSMAGGNHSRGIR